MKATEHGSIKDFLDDLESDITHLKNFEEFEKDKPYLLGWIDNIRIMLGLKEALK